MTLWSGAVFGRSIGLAAFGELADKSFFIFMTLMLWEPMRGIYAGRALWKRFCVFSGAYGALATRTILMAFNIKPDAWHMGFDFLAAAMLLFLNIVSVRDLRREGTFDKSESDAEAEPIGQPKSEGGQEVAGAGNPFSAEDAAPAEPAYGAAGASPEKLPLPEKPSITTLLLGSRAFIITYVVVFLVDIDDKSPDLMLASVHSGFDFAIGALLGQLVSVFAAMVFSFMLLAVFDDKQLAMAVVLCTAGTFLTCLSQALLSIHALQPLAERGSEKASFLAMSAALESH
mmetsp:Transcript_31064/g.66123  ORF Transcript_31064/g.66123 Transcript_31064/m.66123 type:complete len:287 (-) Transcript_31064:64-924(-)